MPWPSLRCALKIEHLLPGLLVLALLIPAPTRAEPREGQSLAAALLEDDLPDAESLARGMLGGSMEEVRFALLALGLAAEEVSWCRDLQVLEELVETSPSGTIRWAALELLEQLLIQCRSWDKLEQFHALRKRPGPWKITSMDSESALEDIFLQVDNWHPGPIADQPEPAWLGSTPGLILARADLCLEQEQALAFQVDCASPWTLWLDGDLILSQEPGQRGVHLFQARRIDLVVPEGCHELRVGVVREPGRGVMKLAYLEMPGGQGSDSGDSCTARLLAGDLLTAALVCRDLEGDLRTLLQALLAWDRRQDPPGPDNPAYRDKGEEDQARIPCLIWRRHLEELLDQGDDLTPWLETWPSRCRERIPGRLLEARHQRDRGLTRAALATLKELNQLLAPQGYSSCKALELETRIQGERFATAPDILRGRTFCPDLVFSDAASFSRPEELQEAAELLLRIRPLLPHPAPGIQRFARRLSGEGNVDAARSLLAPASLQDPEAAWGLADLEACTAGESVPPLDRQLGRAASHPLASLDLRGREGLLNSWDSLEPEATDVSGMIRDYLSSDFRGDSAMVLVLDETIIRLGPNRRITERTTQVFHLQTAQAAQDWNDFYIPSSGQTMTFKTLKPDGSWREPKGQGSGDLATFEGLAADDMIVVEYVDEIEPELASSRGFCLAPNHLAGRELPVFRSRMVILNPEHLPLEHHTWWGSIQEELREDKLVFTLDRWEPLPEEPETRTRDEGIPRVEICSGMSWPDLRNLMASGLLAMLTSCPELADLAADLGTESDPVAAAFAWITGNIAPEHERMTTRSACSILDEHRGNPGVLLLALLREMGFQASLLLANPLAAEPFTPAHFSPEVFTAAVLMVNDPKRGQIWLDPFGPAARFRELRPFISSRPALLLEVDAPALTLRTPPEPGERHRVETRIDLSVNEDLGADGSLRARFTALAGSTIGQNLSQASRDNQGGAVESFLRRKLPGARLSSFNIRMGSSALEVRARFKLPPGTLAQPARLNLGDGNLEARYGGPEDRRTPLLIDGSALSRVKVVLEGPSGHRWRLEGRSGTLTTDFCTAGLSWQVDGDRAEVEYESWIPDTLLEAGRYPEVMEAFRALDSMDRMLLHLEVK